VAANVLEKAFVVEEKRQLGMEAMLVNSDFHSLVLILAVTCYNLTFGGKG
jgi:hypothetical protein